MNSLSKFYAVSAIYLGLASAVGAQQTSSSTGGSGASTGGPVAEQTRQTEFQHPALEERRSTDLRSDALDGQKIQRRGMQGTRQDGDIQRNALPGASRADDAQRPVPPTSGSSGNESRLPAR